MTNTKVVGEWAMFKRRLFAGVACLPVALTLMVLALVKDTPLFFIPAFLFIMAGWVIVQIAADTGTYSGNPKVRECAERVKL